MLSVNSGNWMNTVLSGYSQMNQMKYLTSISSNKSVGAVGASRATSSSTLGTEDTKFLKEYSEKLSKLEAAADKVINGKADKMAAASEDRTVATVSGKLENKDDTYELLVTQTASGQVNRSNGYASEGELPALGGSLKLQTAKGTYNVSLSSAGAKTNHEALEKFAEKINSLNAGVTASVTKKDGKSYLSIEGEAGTGSGGFTASGSAAESLGLDKVETEGRGAVFTLTKNGEETETFTSKTNTVEVDGITVNFKGTGSTKIKAGGSDSSAALDAMEDLVSAYNDVISFLEKNEGRGVGVLKQLKRMVTPPVSERSLEMIGMSVGSDGKLKINGDKFMAKMDENASFVKDLTKRIADNSKQDAQTGLNAPSASLVGSSSGSTGSANKNMFSSVAGGASFGNTDYFKMMSTYSRIGVHNMSNYYAVGMMMNSFI